MRIFRFLLHAFIGYVTPVEVSGRALFRRKLADFGVDPNPIPEGCLNELADQATDIAKKAARLTGNLQTKVLTQIEGQAGLIAELLKTREERYFQDTVGPDFRARITPILDRYGIAVPPP